MDYEKILKGIVQIINTTEKSDIGFVNICTYIGENCPELQKSEDERIKKLCKVLIESAFMDGLCNKKERDICIAWLERQGKPIDINPSEFDLHLNRLLKQFEALPKEELVSSLSFYLNVVQNDGIYKEEKQGGVSKLSEEEQNLLAKTVLTSCASSFIDYLDANKYDGKMCVSNGECEDIENAFHNAIWDKLHRYYCKYIIEKKDEQKSQDKTVLQAIKEEKVDNANKVEPKFKVGDWVVLSTSDGRKIVHVVSIEYFPSGEPRYITAEGKWFGNGTKAHPWTIADAKPGDVLAFKDDSYILLVKEVHNTIYGMRVSCYCHVLIGKFETVEYQIRVDGLYPATKEQRELLFSKMKKAGYEWSVEKKELKKIEQKPKFKVGN